MLLTVGLAACGDDIEEVDGATKDNSSETKDEKEEPKLSDTELEMNDYESLIK
ncbi:hypothetical protein JOC34_002747 [Virgibacillus halotolerans]|uniref:hypothetical protein n=1 Tax=Virgibacillus halotolerans TaxID=1071053 RepID=UPI001960EDB2|nr:hypothetical protein [Virgibacillus halotolerans]MBM7600356.1 hypothetical protein [Virgibacillus halotolerans]